MGSWRLFQGPVGGDAELRGEFLVVVFGEDEAGGAQDGPGVLAGRAEHVDGVVGRAAGDDEPVVVGQDDGPAGGQPEVLKAREIGRASCRERV